MLGDIFLGICDLGVVRREDKFETVSTNLEVLFPNAFHNDATLFTELQEQCLKSGKPWGGTLISSKEKCRICGGRLEVVEAELFGGGVVNHPTLDTRHPTPPCVQSSRGPSAKLGNNTANYDVGVHKETITLQTFHYGVGASQLLGSPQSQLKMEKWHRPGTPYAGVMTYAYIDDKWVRVGLWKDEEIQRQLDSARNKHAYEKIAEAMRVQGFRRTIAQLRRKASNLKTAYKAATDANNARGNGRVEIPFHDQLNAILGHRTATHPTTMLETTTSDVEQTSYQDALLRLNGALFHWSDGSQHPLRGAGKLSVTSRGSKLSANQRALRNNQEIGR
ncbi:hypothetical protein Bbelb_352650 [Branchiostoma belcheri]|nr:hypothetical protein Bbelb_352650 [Branchiostoma belcheri]